MPFGLGPFLINVSVLCQGSPSGYTDEYSDGYDNDYARCDYDPSNTDDNYN